jgi:hypothetical protein
MLTITVKRCDPFDGQSEVLTITVKRCDPLMHKVKRCDPLMGKVTC